MIVFYRGNEIGVIFGSYVVEYYNLDLFII